MAPFMDVRYPSPTTPPLTPRVVPEYEGKTTKPVSKPDSTVDIAVVGMACRLPGGNNSVEQFWESILEKQIAIGDMPGDRWEAYYRRDPRNAKILDDTPKRGYFVPNINDFDNTFFGISPKEAVLMDPQQRMALEVTWEALEHAGIPPQSLAGSNTGCYMGVNSDDFGKVVLEDLPGIEAWLGIGTAYCGIPNRVSYHLDLKGPSTAVDAACASSLVAIHHGRVSLMTGETDLAIVGGVQALCNPGMSRVLDLAGATSKDGECRSFDDSAHGYGRGEGAVVIVLKRLEDALKNDDHIMAVMKGSAVGQDGKTNGIMAPNAAAQEAVARTALGEIASESIQYVEAHATSTAVGDPVEIGAMSQLYGKVRNPADPCYIGSAKSNVGHLEAGAGAVGFAKAVMAVQSSTVPPQTNLKTLNKKIDWETAGLQVALEPKDWPVTVGPRRAAVSSYGYGGTVSHAVIEQAPLSVEQPLSEEALPTVFLLSAPHEKRIPLQAASLRDWLQQAGNEASLTEVASTLASRRGHHTQRIAFVGKDLEDVLTKLDKIATGKSHGDIVSSRVLPESTAGAVWTFSGHGAQWPDMGKQLLQDDPTFRQTVEDLDCIIKKEAGFSAVRALENGDFTTTDQIQVLTFAMQIGIARTLQAKGLTPSAVIGHSVGEIAAAVIAGALTEEDGAIVVCRRAVLYREVMGKGAMAMIGASFAEAEVLADGIENVWPAIEASPSSCVVSGTIAAIDEFSRRCQDKSIQVRRVKSDVAFHTPLLASLAQPLMKALHDIIPMQSAISLYSTALPNARKALLRDASYWVHNMIQPVLLANAVQAAAEDKYRIFLEVSSHPIISQSINETLMDMEIDDCIVSPTLLRQKNARECLLKSMATLWSRGTYVDWKMFFGNTGWSSEVPGTVWQHKEFKKEIQCGLGSTAVEHDVSTHTLLGQRIPIAGEDKVVFTSRLSNDNKPFPGSHPLHGTEIIPAAVLLNTFLKAMQADRAESVHLRVPVAISAPRELQVVASGDGVRLSSRLIQTKDKAASEEDAAWLTHTTAKMPSEKYSPLDDVDLDLKAMTSRLESELKETFSIDYLAGVGVPLMGFPWKVLKHIGNSKEMLALVDACPDLPAGSSMPWSSDSWAPMFDAATSIGSTIFFAEPRLRMPAHVANVAVREGVVPPKKAYIHVAVNEDVDVAADVTVSDTDGHVLAKFDCMRFAEIEGSASGNDGVDGLVHQVSWLPATILEEPLPLEHVVMIDDGESSSFVEEYSRQLTSKRINWTTASMKTFTETTALKNKTPGTVVLYFPHSKSSPDAIPGAVQKSCIEVLEIAKRILKNDLPARLYAVTRGALRNDLSQASLPGLSRIIASEHPQIWGGLIEVDSSALPYQCLKYISGEDVLRFEDSVVKAARLTPLTSKKATESKGWNIRPNGTYLITGGFGALGLEVAQHLVQSGARRLVLVSRRGLPPRQDWSSFGGEMAKVIRQIESMEDAGVTVIPLAMDLTASDAADNLHEKLRSLNLPAISGVVHAAGVVEDQLVLSTTPDAFSRVLAPKVSGALALHQAFPPKTLDFFIMFSSCGQLLGFPGQASYASGNSFLDGLAEHRRQLGDSSVAMQWTSWRGVGGMGDNEFVEAELENRGITSVSRAEAFLAWEHIGKLDISTATVLRSRPLDADERVPHRILERIVRRKLVAQAPGPASDVETAPSNSNTALPPTGSDRIAYLTSTIAACVAEVLQFGSPDEVDVKAALSDMGMDSVMTAAFRRKLQQTLKVKVPPTLVWGHPTVSHLVQWFDEELQK